jgi:hypothetical protein
LSGQATGSCLPGTIEYDCTNTIASVLETIENREGGGTNIRLTHAGKPLKPGASLMDYNILQDDTLEAFGELRGGGNADKELLSQIVNVLNNVTQIARECALDVTANNESTITNLAIINGTSKNTISNLLRTLALVCHHNGIPPELLFFFGEEVSLTGLYASVFLPSKFQEMIRYTKKEALKEVVDFTKPFIHCQTLTFDADNSTKLQKVLTTIEDAQWAGTRGEAVEITTESKSSSSEVDSSSSTYSASSSDNRQDEMLHDSKTELLSSEVAAEMEIDSLKKENKENKELMMKLSNGETKLLSSKVAAETEIDSLKKENKELMKKVKFGESLTMKRRIVQTR